MIVKHKYLWWQTGVIYQIYPRSFKDTSGNGVGDLAGIIEKLDYLSGILGVDAIWLSPFYPSPMADFGYDVSDYMDVDPLFGDLATFDQLVAQAHQSDLKIIIDLVPNHSSDQHPWFQESRSSRDNPKRDWYFWVDPKADGSPPNNWLSVFGGSAWEWDETTGQYYLHSFLKEQPDLNWRNPEVKAAMFDVVRFWLERGVDGFRIDVAHYIMKDPQLRDNPPNPSPGKSVHVPLSEYDYQLHLHDKGHPDVHEIYRQFRQLLDAYSADRPRMAVGEIHIFDWKEWATYYGEHLDELHMPFNFALLRSPWTPQSARQVVDSLEAALSPGAWPNYVLGNHDEPRLASRIGRQQARVAAMLLLTLRGTPTLYYGDEIGMMDVPIPARLRQDPYGQRVPGMDRDPCRTPMQWQDAPYAGCMPPETPDPWLPLADDYHSVNIQDELADSSSMLNLYRRLLAYRKSHPVLQRGDYQPVDPPPTNCFVYLRHIEGLDRLLVALNFSSDDVHLNLPQYGPGNLVISTHLDRTESVDLSNLLLRGDEGVVIELI
ncbi:MAG: alpha-amylase family glycosyl hydrolase [Anaerolineales bacterium]|jgi:alpha-glucosidase